MKKALILLPFLWLSGGCAFKGVGLRATTALIDDGAGALYEESDPQTAREALVPQLKLIELLLRSDPDNPRLLLRAAEGFAGYAFLFLEDGQPERAKNYYLRGRDYALRALGRRRALAAVGAGTLDQAEAALAQARPEDAPALFWAGFGWAGFINLSKDSSAAIAELPRTVAIMRRVRELAPDFHFAGADLFFGVYYASRPAILGGDVRKAREHFLEARRRTGGKYLINYVLEARYLAVAQQDLELFRGLLAKARETEAGALPDARLTDEVAKLKAAALQEKADDLF